MTRYKRYPHKVYCCHFSMCCLFHNINTTHIIRPIISFTWSFPLLWLQNRGESFFFFKQVEFSYQFQMFWEINIFRMILFKRIKLESLNFDGCRAVLLNQCQRLCRNLYSSQINTMLRRSAMRAYAQCYKLKFQTVILRQWISQHTITSCYFAFNRKFMISFRPLSLPPVQCTAFS